ncbi:hypothetical protein AVEN_69570-1 [Araneus ventricosus]|uniref:Uncharacterized protein n=1 Tax=Araneus ventricosus TaxID=182803 RepID=A0A4Y2H8D1_ARAVE|nr:hypothetical protein AVEN_69570-1 [Araneus ventricosus]
MLFDKDVCQQLEMETQLEQGIVYEGIDHIEEVDSSEAGSGTVNEDDFVVVKFTYNEGKKTECENFFIASPPSSRGKTCQQDLCGPSLSPPARSSRTSQHWVPVFSEFYFFFPTLPSVLSSSRP